MSKVIAGLGGLSIARRLQYSLGLILTFMLLLAAAGWWGMTIINNRLNQIADVNNEKISLAQIMQKSSDAIDKAIMYSVVAKDENVTKEEQKKAEEARGEFAEALRRLEKRETSAKGRELIATCKENFTIAQQANERILTLLASGDHNQASTMTLASVQLSAILTEATGELVKYQQKETKAAVSSARRTYTTATLALFVFAAIVLCFAAFVAVYLKNSISKPLSRGVSVARMIGDGDLAVQIGDVAADETGELLKAMQTMADGLQRVISHAKTVAAEVASASQQLNESSETMSKGAGEQASRSSQVATASEEMSQSVTDIAKNTSSIETSATETAKLAKEGERAVDKSVEKVKAIARTIDESGQLIRLLGERSDQIGTILNVIIDIADQTNLLALNAAIEAARAGDAGRGFAVVADEVRKLAERTGSSTAEIGSMIKSIQDQVSQAVASMEGMTQEVKSGVDLSMQGADYLRRIVDSVDQLHVMVQQIASATEEMAATSDEINRDIESIASVSRQTSGSSDEIAQASQKLARLSVDLEGVVSGFKV